ncbi:hypothetical protein CTE05_33170 [Cellulomonas terrae]|uniref:Uncharacterized protein n=1 Tax=Cellulomonas terrae TaxID=311234 RepID=A0A511JP09_9CELL|nr:hypothetical protein CTE05_33170 [Cellulomonas terrae]
MPASPSRATPVHNPLTPERVGSLPSAHLFDLAATRAGLAAGSAGIAARGFECNGAAVVRTAWELLLSRFEDTPMSCPSCEGTTRERACIAERGATRGMVTIGAIGARAGLATASRDGRSASLGEVAPPQRVMRTGQRPPASPGR